MTRLAAALVLAAALPLLSACGRAGPPRPPGPREAITYPRVYPAPASTERSAGRFIQGEVVIDERMVTLVDLPALLAEGGLDVNEVV